MREIEIDAEHETDTKSTKEIAELFAVVGTENETIRQLSGCVENLRTVQAAKRSLSAVTPAEVRAALEYRRMALSESS